MGLLKASNMQLDIEKMSKAAEKASHAPSKEEAAAAADGLCGRCADPKEEGEVDLGDGLGDVEPGAEPGGVEPGGMPGGVAPGVSSTPAIVVPDDDLVRVEEHLRQLRLLGAAEARPAQLLRPAALWADEDPDAPALGIAPVPTAEHLAAAATANARPHPRMACDCPACDAQPERAPEESSSTRPIGIPELSTALICNGPLYP